MSLTMYLREQAKIHPTMEPVDAVKLCYQAVYGAEHLLRNIDAASICFNEEFSGVEAGEESEPLYEHISDAVCRVNLRAWKRLGLPGEWLFNMFTQSNKLLINSRFRMEYEKREDFGHAVGVSPAVTKASAGAVEHMAIAKVTNLAQTIADLKERGIWTYAAEAGGTPYYDVDYHNPCALVFGSEGEGVSRLVKDTCDFIVSIPMYGHVNSLNVSTASAVIINEAKRGQMQKK